MKKLTVGILAHVDAGKTTLAEAMLFESGMIRAQGRVDHKNTVLDIHPLEQNRGITIFTGQAQIIYKNMQMTLLDTPGHVDFSAETERTLQVLDYAILVISGTEGVQSHTVTLWRLLSYYGIPTFVFVTKMDYARCQHEALIDQLTEQFGDGFIDFEAEKRSQQMEQIALSREDLLEQFIETGSLDDALISDAIQSRLIFPCFFGSGLKSEGIKPFLDGFNRFTGMPVYPEKFGGRIFKITYDERGNRLTHLKMTGGNLQVRGSVHTGDKEEKITQIRIYSGKKFDTTEQVFAGDIIAITGLSNSFAGQGLGYEKTIGNPLLEPVMNYRIHLPENCDPLVMLPKLKTLEEEDPQLNITWHAHQQEIHVGLMGSVQKEILRSLIQSRFNVDVTIDAGRVLYKETIADVVEGVGHYEPLRHYAEVHLLLSPLPPGSGLYFETQCSEEMLDRNWQRLILSHLREKIHLGVLTGSPITDIRIVLVSGRAHLKHTEGGDFRQATYRAVRQGLMQAESRLLEPYYDFQLEVSPEYIGRAIHDIQARSGVFDDPIDLGGLMQLNGYAPVTTLNDYGTTLAAYTGGKGKLTLSVRGYGLCHDPDRVMERFHYDPSRDLENTPDSIFCAHGSGYNVHWSLVHEHMDLSSFLRKKRNHDTAENRHYSNTVSDKEMAQIMERLYGKPKETQDLFQPRQVYTEILRPYTPVQNTEIYIVDGYNVLFAWDSLKTAANEDIGYAREKLIHIMENFATTENVHILLVFDGGKVPGNFGDSEAFSGVTVVYTREQQTADAYIERKIHEIGKNERVCIVTSDGLIQLSAVHKGVLRMSAREFETNVSTSKDHIEDVLKTLRHHLPNHPLAQWTKMKENKE